MRNIHKFLLSSITTDLIAAWDMTDPSNIARDFHTSGIHATNNGATYDTTEQAAKFVAASSQYMSIADRYEISFLNQDFTWEFWFKRTSSAGAFSAPIAKYTYEYVLLYGNTTGSYALGASEGTESTMSGISITNDVWYQCFAWYDGLTNTMYLQLNTSAGIGTITTRVNNLGTWRKNQPLVFGALVTNTQFWDGFLKRVRMWKRVLSAKERYTLWNNHAGVPYQRLRTLASGMPNPRGGKDAPPIASVGTPAKITCDGDSLTVGFGSTAGNDYPTVCVANLGSSYTLEANSAVNGQSSTNAYDRIGTFIDPHYDATCQSIVVLWIGTNDIVSGVALATIQANITTYCQWRQNIGFKVCILTVLARTEFASDATKETKRQDLNTWLRANSIGANKVIDLSTDVRLDDGTATLPVAVDSGDHVHLNDLGYSYVASKVQSGILAL